MAYKEFKKGEIAKYYVVSKKAIRGHHVITPYRSKPKAQKGYIIVSGKTKSFQINKNGYATTKSLPKNIIKRRKVTNNSYNQTVPMMFRMRY